MVKSNITVNEKKKNLKQNHQDLVVETPSLGEVFEI